MRAFVRDWYGSPDVLELRDVAKPVIGDDDVLVRVHASSLNQADLDHLYGRPFLTRMGAGLRKGTNLHVRDDAAIRSIVLRARSCWPGDSTPFNSLATTSAGGRSVGSLLTNASRRYLRPRGVRRLIWVNDLVRWPTGSRLSASA